MRTERQNVDCLVSIIIPVYNVQNYIHVCLDSVVNQTYSHLDIVLIDDGSTDDSGKICDRYAARDSRIRVIHQQNLGAANAKNAGLDIAKGDFITFLDSDDWVEHNWIERMLCASETYDADVVECSFLMEYTMGTEHGSNQTELSPTSFITEEYLRMYPQMWTCALFWNKLFKAALISDVRFHKERRCIDDEFFTYKAITGAKKVLRINDELYHYRQRRSSVTQTGEMLYQRTIDDIDILAERHEWMKEHYPGIAMDYLRHDISTLLYFANEYPFNEAAITRFRKSAKYFFAESLCNYPGKVTLFYVIKVLCYPKKKFLSKQSLNRTEPNMDQFFQ